MSDLTLASDAGIEGQSALKAQVITRQAGVAGIVAGMPCYLDSNGLIQKCVTSAQFASGTFGTQYKFDGVPASDIPSGQFGELYGRGAQARIQDSGLTIGNAIFLSATAGKWADAPTVSNAHPVAHVISATSIVLDKGV